MKFVFIDETENSTHLPGFYAVCAVVVDATKYKLVRHDIDTALDDSGWCRDHEFKGSLIFSATKGDPNVTTEQRVDAATVMVSATVSKANSRASSAVAWTDKGASTAVHLELVKQAVSGSLKTKAETGAGKDIAVVFADRKDNVKTDQLIAAVRAGLQARGYVLGENVVIVDSSCEWPGVLLADVIAYLAMWAYAGHRFAGQQLSLFEGDVQPSPAVVKKMSTVQAMLETGSELRFIPKL